jgi:hypothetical protein
MTASRLSVRPTPSRTLWAAGTGKDVAQAWMSAMGAPDDAGEGSAGVRSVEDGIATCLRKRGSDVAGWEKV